MSRPDEPVQQAVGEVVEIVQALAQIGVGLAQHAGAVVGLDALDRGLRREAGGHASRRRRSQPWSWANMRKVSSTSRCSPPMGARRRARSASSIEARRLGDGLVEAREFRARDLGDEVGDDDARLVQHDMAEARRHPARHAPVRHAPAGAARCPAPGRASACNSPEAMISASTMAVVCSASISSSDRRGGRGSGRRGRRACCRRAARGTPRKDVVDLFARSRACRRRPGGSARPSRASGSAVCGDQADEALARAAWSVRWTASRFRPSVAKSSSVPSARST